VHFTAYGREALNKGNPEGLYYVDAVVQLDAGKLRAQAGKIELKR
jgi:hypothetical protein